MHGDYQRHPRTLMWHVAPESTESRRCESFARERTKEIESLLSRGVKHTLQVLSSSDIHLNTNSTASQIQDDSEISLLRYLRSQVCSLARIQADSPKNSDCRLLFLSNTE